MDPLAQALRELNEAAYKARKAAMKSNHRYSTELRAIALRSDEMYEAVTEQR